MPPHRPDTESDIPASIDNGGKSPPDNSFRIRCRQFMPFQDDRLVLARNRKNDPMAVLLTSPMALVSTSY
jgi:hypothetical protein